MLIISPMTMSITPSILTTIYTQHTEAHEHTVQHDHTEKHQHKHLEYIDAGGWRRRNDEYGETMLEEEPQSETIIFENRDFEVICLKQSEDFEIDKI